MRNGRFAIANSTLRPEISEELVATVVGPFRESASKAVEFVVEEETEIGAVYGCGAHRE